jgi:endonuclease YncB( thermonuclease family)
MKTLLPLPLLLITLLLGLFSAHANEDLIGVVTKVADGDTVTLKAEGTTHKIRLAEIDTPERNQPYGLIAKAVLTELLLDKRVRVKVVKESDRYGRVIGRIFLGHTDVSAYMVEMGHAMVYRRYLTDDSLLELEDNAKRSKLGLWKLPEEDRVPPWVWRKQQRK